MAHGLQFAVNVTVSEMAKAEPAPRTGGWEGAQREAGGRVWWAPEGGALCTDRLAWLVLTTAHRQYLEQCTR